MPGKKALIKEDFDILTIHRKRPRMGSLLALLRAVGPLDLAERRQPDWTDTRDDAELRPARRRRRRR